MESNITQILFYFSPDHELYLKTIHPAGKTYPETTTLVKIPTPVTPTTRLDNLKPAKVSAAKFETFELRLALYGTWNELESCNHFGGTPLVRELVISLGRIAAGKRALLKRLGGGTLVTS